MAWRNYRVTEIEPVTPTKNDVVVPPNRPAKTKTKNDERAQSKPRAPSTRAGQRVGPRGGLAASDASSSIDVLVVYTTAAEAAAGGPDRMLAQIQLGVNQTNAAYANFGIPAAIRLVGVTPTPTASVGGDLHDDLTRFSTPGDGYCDKVQATGNPCRPIW